MVEVITVELHPRLVHLPAPTFHSERIKTFDPDRGDAKEPDGEDVVEAHTRRLLQNDGTIELIDVPEVRTPYWGFDDQVPDAPQPISCPDCGTMLASLGHDLICMRLHGIPEEELPSDDHEHPCIVACGSQP